MSDSLKIKQLPTDESYRSPEIAVNFIEKKRIVNLRLCKRKCIVKLGIQGIESKIKELDLEIFSAVSVMGLKCLI